MADRPTTRIRASNGQFSSSRKSGKRRCADCRATSSAQWRTGSDKRTLCNACGIRITREAKRMKEGPSNFGARENPSPDRAQRVASTNSTRSSSSTRPRTLPPSSVQESAGSSSTGNHPSAHPTTRRRSTRLRTVTTPNSSAGTSRRQVQQATQRRTSSGGSEPESLSSSGSAGRAGRGRVGGSRSHSPTQTSPTPSVRVNDARSDPVVVPTRVSDVQPLPPFSSLLDAQQNRNRSRGRCSLANLLNPQ